MQSNQCQLFEPHEPLVILVEYDMCSLLQFPPHLRISFGLVINQSVGSCGEKLIPKVEVAYPLFAIKGYLFYVKYVIYLRIVF